MHSQKEPRVRVRLQWLLTIVVLVFVLLFAAIVTYVSLTGLNRLAQERAQNQFKTIAEQDAQQLQRLLRDAERGASDYARLPADRFMKNGSLEVGQLTQALLVTLRDNPSIYGVFIGLSNGESYRVLAIRNNAELASRLGAPAGTFWAVQHVRRHDGRELLARWQYWSEFGDSVMYGEPVKTDYVGRERPWYVNAKEVPGLAISQPYFFLEVNQLGVTVSHALVHADGVVGMSFTMPSLEFGLKESLGKLPGGLVVTDELGRAVAAYASNGFAVPGLEPLEPLSGSSNPFFARAAEKFQDGESKLIDTVAGVFVYASHEVRAAGRTIFRVVAFSPMDAFVAPLREARTKLLLLTAGLLLVSIPLAGWASQWLMRPLEALANEAARVQHLDFSETPTVRSMIVELDSLGEVQAMMKTAVRDRTQSLRLAMEKLEALTETGIRLATERDPARLMQEALSSAVRLLDAQAGQFWQYSEADGLRLAASLHLGQIGAAWTSTDQQPAAPDTGPCWTVVRNQTLVRFSERVSHGMDFSLQIPLLGRAPHSLIAVPVMGGQKLRGVLVLCDTVDAQGRAVAFSAAQERYAATLAAQTGVVLLDIEMHRIQGELMDSLIQLIAGAIDAKSPYTAGHCNRVPELACALVDAANQQTQGPFAGFSMHGEAEWREFRIGAWLHDCGKVTTPEYVVDKATKLETIYNRIHEVRMRFEVFLRDAEIQCWTAVAQGADPDAQAEWYRARQAQLQEDYAFIAQCNVGAEFMPEQDVARVRVIAQQTWLRHFDDRLGLSHGEQSRLEGIPVPVLPTYELLLADKAEHLFPRTKAPGFDERHGFKMDVPQYLYNIGEVHNLTIQRGTLSPEERFKINEHIMHTIMMLETLPLPESFKRVPEYAGTHHETMKGTGYPRRLDASKLSVPARIMAIADIFEALTAADRPYKKAKPLSEAVRILHSFKLKGHIDPDLFDLLLTSGVYLDYARRFLEAEQIDAVDIAAYVG